MQQDDRQENEDQTVLPIEMNERIYVIRKDDITAVSVNNGITTINTTHRTYQTNEPLNYYERNYRITHLLKFIVRLSLIKRISIALNIGSIIPIK